MSDVSETAPAPEEKPKKQRIPRKAKAETPAAPVKAAKPAKAPRAKKLPHFVTQEGKTIVLSGSDVYCRELSAEDQKKWGIKSVEGALGVPCADAPVTLTFKSPKAAEAFFAHSFSAEDEADEIIVAGGKADWNSTGLSNFLG